MRKEGAGQHNHVSKKRCSQAPFRGLYLVVVVVVFVVVVTMMICRVEILRCQ